MYSGFNGQMHWFTGVVENRLDPLKLGRVQVRIHGIHSEDREVDISQGRGIPTEELPWAFVMQPTNSAAMDGIGCNPMLVEGSHVVGFSRDGKLFNDLIIIGSIGGMPDTPPDDDADGGKIGHMDVRTAGDISTSPRKYNKENNRDPSYSGQGIPQGRYPQEKFLNEPDINRLARGEKLDDTILEEKKTGEMRFSRNGDSDKDKRKRQTGIESVNGTWDEMASFYAAQYPYNHVYETESGHVFEFDDTPENERIHLYHRWGTYFEIGPNGEKQEKIVGDGFTIYMAGRKVYIEGDCDLTVKGNKNTLILEGNIETVLREGNYSVKNEGGNVEYEATDGDITIKAKNKMTLESKSYELRSPTIRLVGKVDIVGSGKINNKRIVTI